MTTEDVYVQIIGNLVRENARITVQLADALTKLKSLGISPEKVVRGAFDSLQPDQATEAQPSG